MEDEEAVENIKKAFTVSDTMVSAVSNNDLQMDFRLQKDKCAAVLQQSSSNGYHHYKQAEQDHREMVTMTRPSIRSPQTMASARSPQTNIIPGSRSPQTNVMASVKSPQTLVSARSPGTNVRTHNQEPGQDEVSVSVKQRRSQSCVKNHLEQQKSDRNR